MRILVVTIHVGWYDDTVCASWFFRYAVKGGIARIAVPFFFIVSGFFLANHFGEAGWYGREVRKRIKSLVVPFMIWTALSLILIVPLSIVADLIAHRPFGTSIAILGEGGVPRYLGLDLSHMPGLYPLWYVRCLFLFVIFSPVVNFLVRQLGWIGLVALYLISVALVGIRPSGSEGGIWDFFTYGLSLSGLFYFSLGVFLSRKGLPKNNRSLALVGGAAGCALVAVKVLCDYGLLQMSCGKVLMPLAIPCLIYSIWVFMPSRRFPEWLASSSFPVFLMHAIVLGYAGVIAKRLPFGEQFKSFFSCGFALVVSVVLAHLLRRRFPKIAKWLFGGR